jgi:glyoxylase-like metal-dependent hydrolase (beta-lactamase superfamily II)
MNFGDFELHLLMAGGWQPDGGGFFGVIPKALWQRRKPADENNLLRAACVGLVVKHHGKIIVCETGIGTKLPEKRARQMGQWEPDGLLQSLKRIGVRPSEVDVVLSTHLHWDHAGGFTTRQADGSYAITFPKAKHFIQKLEWDFAQAPDPRSRAAYYAEDIDPVADAGLVELVDGEAEILPGVILRPTGGHTPGHQLLVFRSGDVSCVMTGDIIPSQAHLPLPWTLAADLDVLRVLQEKGRLLEEAANHRWLLLLSHEVDDPAGYLGNDGSWTPEPELHPR